MFQQLKFRPGIDRSNTRYAREGGWYDCNKVRFFYETPQKIGGWVKFSESTLNGYARALHSWVTLGGTNYLAIGTTKKYYVEDDGALYDITPIRASASLLNPITVTNGSPTVTIADVAHGASVGDLVYISGATAVGGITVAGEYTIVTVPTVDSYTITHSSNASSGATGGGTVTFDYLITPGSDFGVSGTGWGVGGWGEGGWGEATSRTLRNTLRLWSQDNFGEDLVFNVYNGTIYYWDAGTGTGTRAVELTTLSGASQVPTVATWVMVGDERHVIAFGTNPIGSSTQDALFVRWSDQEDAAEWNPSATNTSGGYRLDAGTKIITAMKADRQILIWTDAALYSMQFVGGEYVYSFSSIAFGVSCISPNAAVISNSVVYWMGENRFHTNRGATEVLPCPVLDYVFSDFNYAQREQVYAGVNRRFNEVWWHYPSATSEVNDRYVVYNYGNGTWYYGTMDRTAWLDSPLRRYPIAATASGNLVYHESGVDDYETGSPVAIESYIESADFDLENGDKYVLIQKVIPDVDFNGSTITGASVVFDIRARTEPGTDYSTYDQQTTTRTTAATVDQFTNQLHIRLRGRQAKVKVSSDATGVQWRLGVPRIDGRMDGRKV